MTQRTRWLIGLLALAAVLIAGSVVWEMRRRAGEATSVSTAEPTPAPATLNIAESPYEPWMAFEPASEHGDLFSKYYVDLFLGHQVFKMLPRGIPARQAQGLLLDDDDLLLSSGRRLWTKESLPQAGLTGKYCYVHSQFCLKRLYEVSFVVDGQAVVVYDNQYSIDRFPSRTVTRFALPGVQVDEHKYITWDDRAVTSYQLHSTDDKPHTVALQVVAYNQTMPQSTGPTAFPLLGQGRYQDQPLYLYLDAPGFERLAEAYPFHLRRTVQLAANGDSTRLDIAASFETAEKPNRKDALPSDILERHVLEYEKWFADNVPYFDAPDLAIKKMWYYRWWVVRFNLAEPNTPDLQGSVFYEGKLGFDNLISFAVPAQITELTWLRDPRFGLDQTRNAYRVLSEVGAMQDSPSSPYWGEMYSQWSAGAFAEFNRVHPTDPATLRAMLPAMASDVRAWMKVFDEDGDMLPSRDIPRITGYDLDILSWWYFNGMKLDLYAHPPALERVDFASFVYANAAGVAELAQAAGDQGMADEFNSVAAGIRKAVLEKMWDGGAQFFFPQTAAENSRIPVREIHGFFPFTMRLAPDEAPYVEAMRKFVDPEEFWSRYPPVITSQAHYREWTWDMDGLTRNIAPHPISMGGLTLIRAMHDYRHTGITPEHFMEFLRRYTMLMYPQVHPGDRTWRPNAHEYYSQWEPGARQPLPKPSDISHDFHSMYNALIVQGAVGLHPRVDDKIELRPAARDWAYFALDRVRYKNHDLTILWDQPDGQVRYEGHPEGLSLYIDGTLAFTRPSLAPVLYDPATKVASDAG